MGCWAISGEFWNDETPLGYSGAEDDESRRTIEAAWDAGVRVFDTAAVYGAGHSEELLGDTLGNRDGSLIVTKFGFVFDPTSRKVHGPSHAPDYIRQVTQDSLRRLKRDRVDVLLCHLNSMEISAVPEVFDTLEELRAAGQIGSYGWSTDFPERLDAAAGYPGFHSVEHGMNVFFDAATINTTSAAHDLTQIIRSPLAMGLLTGKFTAGQKLPENDVRSNTFEWMDYFKDGVVSAEMIETLASIREILTAGGRTVGQGALCWLLAKSDALLPVPGMRTVPQAVENAAAMDLGPLPKSAMDELERIIDRPPEGPARER
ncbi:MAG: aldo/keto reductase [Rhodobacteraceae bacterium]|nr:aldo/keto reductase [Paracoccaceae bacterium]